MATNRQRVVKKKLTAKEYFYYAKGRYGHRSSQFDVLKIEDVMCDECDYIPNQYTENPKRCYRDHMKKHHRASFEREFGKEHIIHELDDAVIDAWLRSYV